MQLIFREHVFNRHVVRDDLIYWRCSQFAVYRCRARIKTRVNTLTVLNSKHNHEVVREPRPYGSLRDLKLQLKMDKAKMDAAHGSCVQPHQDKSQ